MGKSSKPLNILLMDADLMGWEEVQKLAAQGHSVVVWVDGECAFNPGQKPDLVLGAACHAMSDRERPYLISHTIVTGRCRRYGHTKSCGHGQPATQEEDPSA